MHACSLMNALVVRPLNYSRNSSQWAGARNQDFATYWKSRRQGTHDEEWVPKLATEGWTVITADGGRTPNRNRGEKLPRLFARLGVTHVLLSPAVHGRTSFEKILTILSVWYPLLEIAADPSQRGKRFFLEPLPSLERGRGRLKERPIPPDLLALRNH